MRPYLVEGLDCSGKKTISGLVARKLANSGIEARLIVGPLVQGSLGQMDAYLANINRRIPAQSVIGRLRRFVYVSSAVIDGGFFRPKLGSRIIKISSHYRAWARSVVDGDILMQRAFEATRIFHPGFSGATVFITDFDTRVQRHREDVAKGRTNKDESVRFFAGNRDLFDRWHSSLESLLVERIRYVQRIDTTGTDPDETADRVAAHALACWNGFPNLKHPDLHSRGESQIRVVMLKPDALRGSLALVCAPRARRLLLALAAHCAGDIPISMQPDPAVARAARQIQERALTEKSFSGTLRDRRGCVSRLMQAADELSDDGTIATSEVVIVALECLGFRIEHTTDYYITEQDIDAIYRDRTAANYRDIRPDLVEYLARQVVRVFWLSGDQDFCVLEHWKTYVRHMLQARTNGAHRLRNLVHVCEEEDASYLTERIHSLALTK